MRKAIIKSAVTALIPLMAAAAAFAQERGPTVVTDDALVTQQTFIQFPNFWLAIIIGVILAVSFELILTHLSVAAGISVAGPFDEPKGAEESSGHGSEGGIMGAVKKTSNFFGIWALITATLALFFASWLSIELANTSQLFRGLVLGLSIWALFYIIMTILEMTALTSLVGMLMRTAVTGLQSAYKATASVFGKSSEDRVVDTAERITAAVRQELFGDMDAKDFRRELQRYIEQLRPASANEIKKALSEMLNDVEIKALVEHESSPFVDMELLTASLITESGMTREKAQHMAGNVKNAIEKLREEYKSDKDTASKIGDAAIRMTGRSSEEAQAMREKFEAYLRDTHKDELNPEGIKRDLEKLLTHPREGIEALRERLSHFDRSTLKAVLMQRRDMTEQDADRAADRVMGVLDKIRSKREETTEEAHARRQGMEAKVRNYLNSLGRPELQYEDIKRDLQVLFHDPKSGADLLINRLKSMDRESIKAIVASRRDVSEEDAERLVSQIEHARDEAVGKYEQMKTEVRHRIDEAKDKALHEAEEARQIARTAAWWTFGSAVVSAAAAVLGGILAAAT